MVMKYHAVAIGTLPLHDVPKEYMIECDDIDELLSRSDVYEVFGGSDSIGYFVVENSKEHNRVYLHFINTDNVSAIRVVRIIRLFLDNIFMFTNGQEVWASIPRARLTVRKLAKKFGFIQHEDNEEYFFYNQN